MVSHPIVEEFLLSKDRNDKSVGWITKVMEYDISIQVTKLVRGKGLCEQIVGSAKKKQRRGSTS